MNKIVVISDNRKQKGPWLTEHGLSIYLETSEYKILLDSGGSSNFIENSDLAGIDLKEIDYLFLSHGHKDHTGGLDYFLEINKRAIVLASPYIFSERYFSNRNGLHEIGFEEYFKIQADRFRFIENYTEVAKGIKIFPCTISDYLLPKGNLSLLKGDESNLIPDDFCHELVITIQDKTKMLYTGCAHKGLLNILKASNENTGANPEIVIGGFHLLDKKNGVNFESDEEIRSISQTLKYNYPNTKFITGHCTGDNVQNILKEELSDRIEFFHSGYTINF